MSRRSQSGFTLLEVLVAAVLMGSVFVAVVSVMSQSMRNIGRMKPHEMAMEHAREKMNEQLVRDELKPESRTGQWDDGYRWAMDITPYDFEAMGKTTSTPQPVPPGMTNTTVVPGSRAMFRVRVTVGWGDAEHPMSYALETMQWATWEMPKR